MPKHLLLLVLGMALSTPASAQVNVVEAGRIRARTIAAGTTVYGMAIDPLNGDVYFIGDTGRSLYRLQPDDTVTRIANNVGSFVGQLSDLLLGPDRRLYAMTTSGTGAGSLQRFELDGAELAPLALIDTTPMSNAAGIGQNCVGDILVSDQEVQVFRVNLAGEVTTMSVGWEDVDDISGAHNNMIFVQDGSARAFGHDKVFLVADNGVASLFASGLPGRIYSGAYDWVTRDYFALNYEHGELYRLTDTDGDLVADMRSTVADNIGANEGADVQFGPVVEQSRRVLDLCRSLSRPRNRRDLWLPRSGQRTTVAIVSMTMAMDGAKAARISMPTKTASIQRKGWGRGHLIVTMSMPDATPGDSSSLLFCAATGSMTIATETPI